MTINRRLFIGWVYPPFTTSNRNQIIYERPLSISLRRLSQLKMLTISDETMSFDQPSLSSSIVGCCIPDEVSRVGRYRESEEVRSE